MDYRYGNHPVYQIEYHFVWVTKYRYHVLRGELGERVRELVRQTCDAFEIRIVRGVVSKDHVHILVSSPTNLAPSEIMRRIKGRTSDALIVPRFSVLQGVDGGHYVFKVVVGELVRQAVQVGLRNDLDFEILEGLSLDDRIVAAPDTEMREWDPVH